LKNPKILFAFAVFWFLLILFLLCLPGSEFPKNTWLTKIRIDKWVHILLFFVLVVTWCLAINSSKKIKDIEKFFKLIAILSLLYGITMEIVQHFFIPLRSFELGDIAADGLGSWLGYLFTKRRLKIKIP